MILADRRFGRSEKYSKLPKWLRDNINVGATNLSVEESLAISKKFLRQMAQPFTMEHQLGIRNWLYKNSVIIFTLCCIMYKLWGKTNLCINITKYSLLNKEQAEGHLKRLEREAVLKQH